MHKTYVPIEWQTGFALKYMEDAKTCKAVEAHLISIEGINVHLYTCFNATYFILSVKCVKILNIKKF